MNIWKMICSLVVLSSYMEANAANGNIPGYGTIGNPFLIEDRDDLLAYASNEAYWGEGNYTRLTADIDLSGRYWTPIGTGASRFEGVFEGGGHVLRNVTLRDTLGGIFGSIYYDATVRNLGVEAIDFTSSANGGGICAFNYGQIVNCHVGDGEVRYSSSSTSTRHVGGICGENYGWIAGCSATCSVKGGYKTHVGGLCGWNLGTIEYCFASGSVYYDGYWGMLSAGGLCGYNYHGMIRNSFATGSVRGGQAAGGFCGKNEATTSSASTILNCYATGDAQGVVAGNNDYVGGFCGVNYYSKARIENCYSTGTASGGDGNGGFCGRSGDTIANCFWDAELSGLNVSDGGNARSTADMQWPGTFVGWDFVEIWAMNGDYPILWAFNQPVGEVLYSISNGEVTITDCDASASGSFVIPSAIEGYPVTSLSDWAFRHCDDLTGVTIPASVTNIGDSAFSYCSSLTNATFAGDAPSSFGANVFAGTPTSFTIQYGAEAEGFTSPEWNGYPCEMLVPILDALSVLEWSITDGEVTIMDCDWSTLGSLAIPSTIEGYPVTAIGNSAFFCCYRLTDVTIPSGVITIGRDAFSGCDNLTNVIIPDSVTTIGEWAFFYSVGLTNIMIGTSVTNIGNEAFGECWSLTSVSIPDSVTTIGYNPFNSCSSLMHISVDAANPAYCSVDGVLFSKNRDELIGYPAGISDTSYMIPPSVTHIGERAFSNCDSLSSINIADSVSTIGRSAFYGCNNLMDVTIPSSVTSLGEYAFSGCDGLTSVTIPASVTKLGEYAFSGCDSLANVMIEASLTAISDSTFQFCTNLTNVIIPDSVACIGSDAFQRCTSLESIIIPDSVTSFRSFVFRDCVSLMSVIVGSSVTNVGYGAFLSCDSLTNATFTGDAPTEFGSSVFDGAASGFKVCFYEGAEGFTTPTWKGYPCEMIPALDPYVTWQSIAFAGSGYSATQMGRDADPDGDGQSNFMEYVFGTSPTNGLDGRVLECRMLEGGMKLDVRSCEKRWYAIEGTDDLTTSNWVELVRFFGTGTNMLLIDPDAAAFENQYYRIKAEIVVDDPALNDADGDGVNDMSDSAPFSKDSDGDGLPDDWEQLYSLNASVSNTVADADSDGYSDYAEYVFGTRPDDAGSRFGWGTSNWLDGGMLHSMLSVGTASGRVYWVEYTPSLTNEWNVLKRFGGSGGTNNVEVVPESQQEGFYRIKATAGNVLRVVNP